MLLTVPIVIKLLNIQRYYGEIFCFEFYPNSLENVEIKGRIFYVFKRSTIFSMPLFTNSLLLDSYV